MDQIVPRQLHFDRFTLDLTRGCLRVAGGEIELPPKAFDVLRVLAENAGRLVSKQELYDAVWPGVTVTDDSLVQRIRELRQVLGDDDHSLIKTVHRRGYLLHATPQVCAPDAAAGQSVPVAAGSIVTDKVVGDGGLVRQRWLVGSSMILLLAALVVAAAWVAWPRIGPHQHDLAVAEADRRGSAPANAQQPAAGAVKTLKMQSMWSATMTLQDNFKMFAERVEKLTGGAIKIEAHTAGQIVPPLEILDATHKKVIDGGHGIAHYWVGKNKTATLFSATPAGPFGMDHMDFLGWMYEGGGIDLYWEFYRDILKLDVVAFPIGGASPQAFGWFKRPIKDLNDFKGLKCRQAGIVAEVYQRMGMQTVNMPAGDIVPSAQGGVIDCVEWIGGIDDLRLGLPGVWKYHYTPGMQESNSMLELIINLDVWKSFTPQQQEQIRAATLETFVKWGVRWQKQNADAVEEMRTRHGTQFLRTPPDILIEFMKAWDKIAEEESAKDPFFKKVYESQRAYAAKVVPAKRFMFPPYSFAANYYWPEPAR